MSLSRSGFIRSWLRISHLQFARLCAGATPDEVPSLEGVRLRIPLRKIKRQWPRTTCPGKPLLKKTRIRLVWRTTRLLRTHNQY
jgi:hypothetical protein